MSVSRLYDLSLIYVLNLHRTKLVFQSKFCEFKLHFFSAHPWFVMLPRSEPPLSCEVSGDPGPSARLLGGYSDP